MLISLMSFLMAIAAFQLSKRALDEAVQVVVVLCGLIGLMLSLVMAPVSLKLLLGISLLIIPTCVHG